MLRASNDSDIGETDLATHELHSSPETCHWGYFDSQLKPSLAIRSGDIATIHCVSGSAEILPGEPFKLAARESGVPAHVQAHPCRQHPDRPVLFGGPRARGAA